MQVVLPCADPYSACCPVLTDLICIIKFLDRGSVVKLGSAPVLISVLLTWECGSTVHGVNR